MKEMKTNKKMVLTSVKMQTVMINHDFENEYFTPILRFGMGKDRKFKIPLYLQDPTKVKECYDEIMKLKGKSIEVVRENHSRIIEMFKDYSWKKHEKL